MSQNTLHTGLPHPDPSTAYDRADGSIGRTRSSTAEHSVHIGEVAGAAPAGSTIRTKAFRHLVQPHHASAFWAKVKRGANNRCWPFTGSSRGKMGYGRVTLPRPIRCIAAHRMAWVLANGEIPDGMFVLHNCDNPKCCNPDHLWLGSIKDNNRDKIRKRRHWNAKAVLHPKI